MDIERHGLAMYASQGDCRHHDALQAHDMAESKDLFIHFATLILERRPVTKNDTQRAANLLTNGTRPSRRTQLV